MLASGSCTMRTPSIVVAADAGPSTGLGHLSRSSALVLALRARAVKVRCVALGAAADICMDGVTWSAGDIDELAIAATRSTIVLDSYDVRRDEVEAVACFHDEGHAPRRAALVISVGTRPPGPANWCCGLAYACLRPVFSEAKAAPLSESARRVLITTGGGDPDGAAERLIDASREVLPDTELRLVVGPQTSGPVPPDVVLVHAPESLYDEMHAADLVICGAGQTAFEAISLGVPTIAVPLVSNQFANAARLEEARVARVVWPGEDPRPHLSALAANPGLRVALGRRGRTKIDGRGADRVAERIADAHVGVTV